MMSGNKNLFLLDHCDSEAFLLHILLHVAILGS